MKARANDLEIIENLLHLLNSSPQAFEVPVAAAVYDQEMNLVSQSLNQRESTNDPTSHAEICVLRVAGIKNGNWNLEGFSLFITLEPCLMCAGAIQWSRFSRIVFGAGEPKFGFERIDKGMLGKTEVVGGVLSEECSEVMKRFFRERRKKNN